MIKMVVLVKRKSSLTYEEFQQHWKETHGPLAAKVVPGMRKYIQDHLVELPGVKNEFDGITEVWFDDVEAFQRYLAWRQTDEAKVLHDDEDKFVDMSMVVRYIVEEHIMK